jgi:hypothetical protein
MTPRQEAFESAMSIRGSTDFEKNRHGMYSAPEIAVLWCYWELACEWQMERDCYLEAQLQAIYDTKPITYLHIVDDSIFIAGKHGSKYSYTPVPLIVAPIPPEGSKP